MTHQENVEYLKEFYKETVRKIEAGEPVAIASGYAASSDTKGKYNPFVQDNAEKIVRKLLSLGYECTTNHGYGCKDWTFFKAIELE